MKKKIKLSVGIIVSMVMLFGVFAVGGNTKAEAMTCNSATLTGTVNTGTPPTRARFTYATDYSTVASGAGTPTTVQTFNNEGTYPIS
ncbi:MAG: hypothetical protein ABIS26_01935, partial [Candidatus Paceibacterota bacterium]